MTYISHIFHSSFRPSFALGFPFHAMIGWDGRGGTPDSLHQILLNHDGPEANVYSLTSPWSWHWMMVMAVMAVMALKCASLGGLRAPKMESAFTEAAASAHGAWLDQPTLVHKQWGASTNIPSLTVLRWSPAGSRCPCFESFSHFLEHVSTRQHANPHQVLYAAPSLVAACPSIKDFLGDALPPQGAQRPKLNGLTQEVTWSTHIRKSKCNLPGMRDFLGEEAPTKLGSEARTNLEKPAAFHEISLLKSQGAPGTNDFRGDDSPDPASEFQSVPFHPNPPIPPPVFCGSASLKSTRMCRAIASL